jgi:hypothetical protein
MVGLRKRGGKLLAVCCMAEVESLTNESSCSKRYPLRAGNVLTRERNCVVVRGSRTLSTTDTTSWSTAQSLDD